VGHNNAATSNAHPCNLHTMQESSLFFWQIFYNAINWAPTTLLLVE